MTNATRLQVCETPDGFMICGPHAQTAQENLDGNTISSIYVIAHHGYACVVDTGRYAAIYEILDAELRRRSLRVRYIVLTHDHYDHVGNAETLRRQHGGVVLAHKLDVPLMVNPLLPYDHEGMCETYGDSLRAAYADMGKSEADITAMGAMTARHYSEPLAVDVSLGGDTLLDLQGLPVHLLHTPGHSPGGITVHVPSSASVYTGDVTFWVNPCRPWPIGNARHCVESLRRIQALNPSYCGHGHYNGIARPEEWLEGLLQKHRQLEEGIWRCLSQPRTLAQVRQVLFPEDPFDSFAPIPENSIQAWLVSLLQEGRVTRLHNQDEVFWCQRGE